MLVDQDLFQEIKDELSLLPQKMNFKIGEVAKFLKVKPHVLRYWEEEFTLLKPKKFFNNQRLYFKKDIEILFLIKNLLYDKKFSVKGVHENLSHYYRKLKETRLNDQNLHKREQVLRKKLESLVTDIQAMKSRIKNQVYL